MKVSVNWLREWAAVPAETAALVDQLTMQGLEVDDCELVGERVAGVVVGRVVDLQPHPKADRLRVCRVDAGDAELQIVCGAPNVRVGGLYPLARVGAVLPGGVTIKAAALRGIESAGMLCSARELGLASDLDGLLELDGDATPGADAATLLGLPDAILDINITPNRADCFSLSGIARDLSAAGRGAAQRRAAAPVSIDSTDTWPARVDAAADCGPFALRVIAGLRAGVRSPLWLRERLRRAGIRSVHPVVDVTNYVMLETGQPLHAYDRDKLRGALTVRRALAGERLVVLGGRELELAPDVLVISDAGGPVGVAGIVGGEASGVGDATSAIVLESAAFMPGAVAGRARRYGLQTDASMRFERGVDPCGQIAALDRATELLLALVGGKAGPVTRAGADVAPRSPVRLRRARLAAVLGTTVADAEVTGILDRLGFAPAAVDDGWTVQPPSFRFDIEREVDLIEEVARVRGYGTIPAVRGPAPGALGSAPETRLGNGTLRQRLVARGYQEVITYSFTEAGLDERLSGVSGPRLQNPISAELAVLRGSIWPGLIEVLRHNLARQQERVRIFELGRRYRTDAGAIAEDSVFGGLVSGPVVGEQWGAGPRTPADFFDIKSDLEAALRGARALRFVPEAHPALHPGQSARIVLESDGRPVGWAGVMHPRLVRELDLVQAPVLFEVDTAVALECPPVRYAEISRFPSVRRDVALLVARDLAVDRLTAAARAAAGPVLREVIVFDVYAGNQVEAGLKSVALGLILQESSRTLTDADVDGVLRDVVQRLARDCAARIRE